MLFMAWSDTGSVINAYCVPDSFSGYSQLDILVDGTLYTTMQPNAFNEYMEGRHETGNVGFVIDQAVVSNLETITDLEIRDHDTGILVYRRQPERAVINESVFRLETHLFPISHLDNALRDKFRFWYKAIDQFSAETARQILSFHCFGSLYSSGRLLFSNFEHYIRDHQKSVALLHEPYEELAERLFTFNRLGGDSNKLLGDRDAMIFAPILELSSQLLAFDEKELRRVLGKADPRVLHILSNPLTRQLTVATPDAFPDRNGVARALSGLSEFAIVCTRRKSDYFREALAELLSLASTTIPKISENPRVAGIAEVLRSIRWIEPLIESDLEVHHHVNAAINSA
jgi:hypothetical protein